MSPVAVDSYGTPEGVAALAMTWTSDGEWLDATIYVDATNPSLETVITWIDQVSAMLNTALENQGFQTPLTVPRSILAASHIVEGIVSDLARYVNQKGRFFSDKFAASGVSLWQTIRNDLKEWALEYAPGLESDGNPRPNTSIKIGVRSHDENGNEMFPIFQRDAFGNRFTDWSKKSE